MSNLPVITRHVGPRPDRANLSQYITGRRDAHHPWTGRISAYPTPQPGHVLYRVMISPATLADAVIMVNTWAKGAARQSGVLA